jgi:hypothetical protein
VHRAWPSFATIHMLGLCPSLAGSLCKWPRVGIGLGRQRAGGPEHTWAVRLPKEAAQTLSSTVSSGSVTVNADSSVQLLAEEAVTLDMLDLGVSSGWETKAGQGRASAAHRSVLSCFRPCLSLTLAHSSAGSPGQPGEGAVRTVRCGGRGSTG